MGNQLTIVSGRITEPKWNTSQSGKRSLQFSIPVNIVTGRAEQQQRETVFYNVRVWEQTADKLATQIHKGAVVSVSGVVRVTSYQKRNTNETALNHEFMMGAKVSILQSDNFQENAGNGGNQGQGNSNRGGNNQNNQNQNSNQNRGYQGDDGFMDGGYDDQSDFQYQPQNNAGQGNRGQGGSGYRNQNQGGQNNQGNNQGGQRTFGNRNNNR